MAGTGRIYRRGLIYYIAYRWDGREYRESARSADRAVAQRLLATRLGERRGSGVPITLTFDALAASYLDDYGVRRLRTLDTARGRVAHLTAAFGGWPATAITIAAIRDYQRTRRAAGAAAATVNRETSALSRMFQLAVRSRQLDERPMFPERLEENGPRQGFFEHNRVHGGASVLTGAVSGCVGLCVLLRVAEARDSRTAVGRSRRAGRGHTAVARAVEDAGGPGAPDLAADQRRVGAAAGEAASGGVTGLSSRRGDGQGVASRVAGGLSAGGGPRTAAPRLPPDDGAQSGAGRGPRTGGDGADRAQDASDF